MAMVETNDTAECLQMPKAKVTLRGTPEKQAVCTRTLLALADRKRFQFVVSSSIRTPTGCGTRSRRVWSAELVQG